jgi:ATP-dependent helicase/DNAse subunit B
MAFSKKQDKFSALWLSHSSLGDYLKCPRLYYIKNIWKNEAGRKVNIVSPHMSLGSAVHQVIEPLALLKSEDRLQKIESKELLNIYEKIWPKYSEKMGGFLDIETEKEFKARGIEMIKNVLENPGPIIKKTVKFYTGDFIPNIYLSEKDNIILCGLVDWVEYVERDDTLRVIDFKTGNRDEKEDSFQLPIYKILVESLQKRKVSSAAYWYLAREKFPTSKELNEEDVEDIKNQILKIGQEIKKIKDSAKNKSQMEEMFKCKYSGTEMVCYDCKDAELIRNYTKDTEEIEYLGVGEYKQDLYLIKERK